MNALNDHKTSMYVNCVIHYFSTLQDFCVINMNPSIFCYDIFVLFLWCKRPNSCLVRFIVEVSRSHTETYTSGRTPLQK